MDSLKTKSVQTDVPDDQAFMDIFLLPEAPELLEAVNQHYLEFDRLLEQNRAKDEEIAGLKRKMAFRSRFDSAAKDLSGHSEVEAIKKSFEAGLKYVARKHQRMLENVMTGYESQETMYPDSE